MFKKIHRSVIERAFIALVLLIAALIPKQVHATKGIAESTLQVTDGDLDTTFGTGGIVTTDFNGDFDFGSSVVLQPDGKIIVVGWSLIADGSNSDFVLARYMPDGSLDPTFDSDGRVITDFASMDDGYAVALQADGKILLAGTIDMSVFALVRYNSDGSLDTTFDNDGIVTTALGQDDQGSAYAVAVQPDEKIVLAGQRWSNPDSDFALVRYNSDGSLDAGFGVNGIVTTDFGTHAVGNAIVIQPPDGKIIVAGESGNTDNKSITLARYNSDGSLDTTFDSDGKVVTSLGINDIAEDLTLQPDGKILAAGSGNNSDGGQDFVLVRYNSDGSLDTTFGLDGRVLTDFGSREFGRAVAVQPDGRILMTGAGNDRTTLALARYQNNGALDTGFGANGKVITSIPDKIVGFDFALQPDHNIIVVGGCCNGSNVDFMVARYIYHAAPAATLTVTKTADTNDGICDSDCSLREAIVSSYDGDVIRFDSSLAGKTIPLASTLVIDKDLTIDASLLPTRISISGNDSVTVFEIAPEKTASLNSLIITNGSTTDWQMGGGILNYGVLHIINSTIKDNKGVEGGGIRNLGILDIKNSQITNNSANIIADSGAVGGGILNYGTLTVADSTLDGNLSQGAGGGIYNDFGTTDIIRCMFSNNSSQGGGGGIGVISGSLKITASTFSTNSAETGGAIYNNVSGVLEVRDSVFSENSALVGGAIITFAENPVTITNGTFSVNSASSNGGAIIHQGYELNIVDSSFTSNSSGAAGGAVANYSQSIMRISNTTFSKNSAEDGGAFYNSGKLTITGSTFLGNLATRSGGAGNFLVSGPSSITGSSFSNNSALDGGGIYNYSSAPELTNVTFTGNSAENGYGGGLLNYAKSNPSLTNVVFSGNSANSGGGMSNTESSPMLTDVTFSDNLASSDGGGMFSLGTSSPALNKVSFLRNSAISNGGGMYNFNTAPVLANVTFTGNSAGLNGGGIYNDIDGNPILRNVTLSGNSALGGGGVFNFIGTPTITNSISWGNTGGEIGNNTSVPVVTYSIVQGGYAGTGNLNVDPKLAPLADNGGFTQTMALQPSSPAINAGSDTDCPLTDQRGIGRPQGPHCDIGAYEFVPTAPVTRIVTKTADTDDGICDTDCSLREAIVNSYDGDTIKFAVSGTILLSSGLPVVNKTVVVDGIGQAVVIDGAGSYRIFKIEEAGNLTIQNLTLQNGHSGDPCMQDVAQSCGGAIHNNGNLSVANVTLQGNTADMGGAIFIEFGTTSIENSTFIGNSAVRLGGGILNWIGTLDVVNSTFQGNSAAWDGGAIYNDISSLSLKNNTFSNNSASRGGAVYNSAGDLAFANNILANSVSGDDCFNEDPYATISSNVHNLIETNAAAPNNCGMPTLNADPKLDSLANNGGITQTMALPSGSPAIDAGDDASCPLTDQRGVKRPYGSHCDIGAFERNGGSLPTKPTFADVPTSYPFWQDIEILYANGLTGGCSTNPLKFCPDQIMNRGQAAVFILRANFSSGYVPPVPTHIFRDDWSKGTWAEPWAEGMYKEGLSAGCLANPLKYCPWNQIPREQAVVFALRMKYGKDYIPPAAKGTVFADMTDPSYYATSWAEQAYEDGIIQSCGMSGGKPLFCPKAMVSRGLAAYMIVRAKNLIMP